MRDVIFYPVLLTLLFAGVALVYTAYDQMRAREASAATHLGLLDVGGDLFYENS